MFYLTKHYYKSTFPTAFNILFHKYICLIYPCFNAFNFFLILFRFFFTFLRKVQLFYHSILFSNCLSNWQSRSKNVIIGSYKTSVLQRNLFLDLKAEPRRSQWPPIFQSFCCKYHGQCGDNDCIHCNSKSTPIKRIRKQSACGLNPLI